MFALTDIKGLINTALYDVLGENEVDPDPPLKFERYRPLAEDEITRLTGINDSNLNDELKLMITAPFAWLVEHLGQPEISGTSEEYLRSVEARRRLAIEQLRSLDIDPGDPFVVGESGAIEGVPEW